MNTYKINKTSVKILEIKNNERKALSARDYRELQISNSNVKKLSTLLIDDPKQGKEIGSPYYMKKSTHRFLKTVNISENFLVDLSTIEYCKPGNSVFPKKNEILIVKDGVGNGLGNVALYPYNNDDNMDSISSGLISINVKEKLKYYVLAMLKSQHFKDFIDLNTAQGSTIRHSQKIALEYNVPFPVSENNISTENVIKLVDGIMKNIISKEKQIKKKEYKINEIIYNELKNNQKVGGYKQTHTRISLIKEKNRLDSGLYERKYKELEFLIENYKNSFFTIPKDKFKSGSTPKIRIFNPKNSNFNWVTPTLITDNGFYKPYTSINMKTNNNLSKDSILIINRTSKGKKGEYVGIACYYPICKYGKGHHNQGIYRIEDYTKEEKLFIVCLLNSDLYRKLCGCISIGSKMKEMKVTDFSELKFLDFKVDRRNEVIREYYNEVNKEKINLDNYINYNKNRNQSLGIFQNSYELVELRKKLDEIIHKIIFKEEIKVDDYL